MARKWPQRLLLCLVHLALLPGCQLPIFRSAGPAEVPLVPEPTITKNATPSPEKKPLAAVKPTDVSKPAVASEPATKNIEVIPAGPSLDPGGTPTDRSKLADTGISGFMVPAEIHAERATAARQKLTAFPDGFAPALPQVITAEKKSNEYEPLVKALQCILEDRNPEAIQHLQVYDRDTQEFFLRLLPTLSILVKTPLDKLTPPQIAMLNDQLYGILRRLRPRSELGINKMCYCRRIRGFGSYDSLPESHAFVAGTKDRPGEDVLLYIELKNFASEPAQNAEFLTKLAVALELRDANNRVIWDHRYDRQDTTHRRKTHLNDFCSGYSFYVPDVAPGAYQLTIQVTDETIPELQRIARKTIDFRVTPVAEQPSLR